MRTIQELKERLDKHTDKQRILFQWVKTVVVSFNGYKILLEYINQFEKNSLKEDEL